MLNFYQFVEGKLICCRGSALVEYAILLAFVAVVAVFFTPVFDFIYLENGNWFGQNIYTHIHLIILKVWDVMMGLDNAIPS